MLTPDQREALRLAELGHSFAIVGQAGTGKTHLIKEIERTLKNNGKKMVITASTGMASRQFQNGRTVHEWAGLGDGRYYDEELFRLLKSDEKKHVLDRIRETDVLIIDEISMISRKTFQQLEYVCRTFKDPSLCFGGLQVIPVGDFFQIPPQANDLYSDPGFYAFTGDAWKAILGHRIELTTVLRQKDQELVTAVNELEHGRPSEHTNELLYRLSRPLPDDVKPVYLYARNFDVDCHNSMELAREPGDIFSYQAHDTGNLAKLQKIMAKKVLTLKLNCPVMLIRNLSAKLVNGMIGTVVGLDHDGPTVKFGDSIHKMVKQSFTVYNPAERRILSERQQYPITLAFAITIHKAQGQTIKNVVVDCRNIFQPGQVGVAVGRSVDTTGLCVRHYDPSCCKKHSQEVNSYYELPSLPPNEDLTCCKKIHQNIDLGDDGSSDQVIFSEEESDFNEEDLQAIEDLEKVAVEHDEQQPVIIQEDIPTRFCEEEVKAMLTRMYCQTPMTANQHSLNSDITLLKLQMRKVHVFVNEQYKNIVKMKTDATKKGVVDWNQFFKAYQSALSSASYKSSCVNLYSPRPVNSLTCGTLLSDIRKAVVSEHAETEKKQSDESSSSNVKRKPVIKVSAYGKIRYVGGRSVAKVKYHYRTLVNNELDTIGVILDTNSKTKVALLESVTVLQADVLETTRYKDSTVDTYRKQNMSCGLTNISDKAFEFFLRVEETRLPLYAEDLLTQHGINLLNFVHDTMLSNKELYHKWVNLFVGFSLSSMHLQEQKNTSCDDILSDIAEASVCIKELFHKIVTSYLNVTDAEFRRKVTSDLGKQKMMEHRKQVLTKQSKTSKSALTMLSIIDDKSQDKTASHYRLKGAIMQKESVLENFTKKDIVLLAKAYDTVLSNASKKEVLIKKLSEKIVTYTDMPLPGKLSGTTTPTAQLTQSKQSPETPPDILEQSHLATVPVTLELEEEMAVDATEEKGKGKGRCRGKGKGKTKQGKGKRKGESKVKGRQGAVQGKEEKNNTLTWLILRMTFVLFVKTFTQN